MNVVTKSWIIVTLTTTGCEKITNSRQHSKPIEYEKVSRQIRQRSREKEGSPRFANEGHFSLCLRGFWVSLWTLESEVREWAFFVFLKFVMNFLKGVVSICRSFRTTGQRGRTNGFDRCFQVVDQCRARRILSEKSFVLFIQYFLLARSLRDRNNGRFAA